MDLESAIKLYYDTFATEYDGVDQGVERIVSRLEISPGSRILDVGCGTSHYVCRR
jgi:ubiquinone/menaquinone biosynthesis C-methylase UbiE